MVQTKQGAGDNPWISYMRACATNYHAGVSQSKPAKQPVKPKTSAKAKPAKQPVKHKTSAKAKPTKPMDAKDVNTIKKAVAAHGKAKAKEKAKEAKKT
jgi:hypothetical protein